VAWGHVDVRQNRSILRASRSETAILLATFFSTLFLELEYAIYVGVIMSLVIYLNRTSRPVVGALVPDRDDPGGSLSSSPGQPECSQLKIIEVHGSLFFGAVSHVQQVLQAIDLDHPQQKHVLVVASSINFTDVAGAEMLVQEARRRRRMGGGLYLAGVKGRTLELLRRGGYLAEIGEENVFVSLAQAIEQIDQRLDKTICQRCQTPVFEKCASLASRDPKPRRPAAAAIEAAMTAAAFAEAGEMDTAKRIMADARRAEPADRQGPQGDAPRSDKARGPERS
jgi:SulP family sulfate permease